MNKKNIGINAVLNVIKSMLSVLFPLVTYPYAIRVLGAEGVGKVSYTASIISYFTMIATLGAPIYGIREGAKRKSDTKALNLFVNEVFTINCLSTLMSYIILTVVVIGVKNLGDYKTLIGLQSLSIFFATFGLDWINTIYEDFGFITLRSIVTHLISIVLLFILVKSPNDYYWYAMLTVITNGVVCISNWFYIRKYVKPRVVFKPHIWVHFKSLLYIFSNTVAIAIYVNFDITMLGWMKGDEAVGLYSAAVKVYTIMKSIMAAVYAVAVPRLAFYIGRKREEEYKKMNTDLWGSLSLLLIPTGVGLICISKEIMQFMGGADFIEATRSLQILSVSLIFAIYGGLVTAVLNITLKREKINLVATVIGAIINGVLNLFLIPILGVNGAALTTLISEMFVFLFCFVRLPRKKDYLDLDVIKRCILETCIGVLLIVALTICTKSLLVDNLIRISIIIPGSVLLYIAVLIKMKNKYVMLGVKKVISYIKKVKGYK